MERIGVTHAGSLIRPPELLAFLSAADHGQASTDGRDYQATLGRAVDYVVRRQVETGIDVVDDGEMGKATWITYLYERTTGLEPRPLNGSFSTILPASRDRQNFPGAYAELDRLEHDATVRIRDEAVNGGQQERQGAAVWVCTGPMRCTRSTGRSSSPVPSSRSTTRC
jgi:5-methyltetrahydropteroyltriglutamate--homocysteine methyltransferase